MESKQANTNPIVSVPKISIFDKKGQANMSRFTKLQNNQQPKGKVNLPQVRINQHKGA